MGPDPADVAAAGGVRRVVLRPGGFHSNAFAWAEMVRTRRSIMAPFGDVGLPSVDPADIAAVAAVTLREDGYVGSTLELTILGEPTPDERRVSGDVERVLGRAPRSFAEWAAAHAATFA